MNWTRTAEFVVDAAPVLTNGPCGSQGMVGLT
jgi:hypothetical protein